LEDVIGELKDLAGVEDMTAGVKGTTGVENGVGNGAEATKNGIRPPAPDRKYLILPRAREGGDEKCSGPSPSFC
jgi:hypothetical protein